MNRSGNDATLKVLYLNGMTAKAKVNLDIRGDRYKEFTAVLKEFIGYEGTLKLDEKEEQLAQKFTSFFPEQTSEQDRVASFLSGIWRWREGLNIVLPDQRHILRKKSSDTVLFGSLLWEKGRKFLCQLFFFFIQFKSAFVSNQFF